MEERQEESGYIQPEPKPEGKKKLPYPRGKAPYPTYEKVETIYSAWLKGGKAGMSKVLDQMYPDRVEARLKK